MTLSSETRITPTKRGPTPPPIPESQDGERWLPVVGNVGYLVSNRGNLLGCQVQGPQVQERFRQTWNPMKTRHSRHGYLVVGLYGVGKMRSVKVHRLVLLAFAGPCPPGMQCRHLNGVKTDNRFPENLKWGTRLENAADAIRLGEQPRGERAGRAKIKHPFQAALVRVAYGLRLFNGTELAAIVGVDQRTVSAIVLRKIWDHVPDLIDTSWLDVVPRTGMGHPRPAG